MSTRDRRAYRGRRSLSVTPSVSALSQSRPAVAVSGNEATLSPYGRPPSAEIAAQRLPKRFGFAIEYTGSASSLRYYEPGFAVIDTSGSHLLVETKGREDVDVRTRIAPPGSGALGMPLLIEPAPPVVDYLRRG